MVTSIITILVTELLEEKVKDTETYRRLKKKFLGDDISEFEKNYREALIDFWYKNKDKEILDIFKKKEIMELFENREMRKISRDDFYELLSTITSDMCLEIPLERLLERVSADVF